MNSQSFDQNFNNSLQEKIDIVTRHIFLKGIAKQTTKRTCITW